MHAWISAWQCASMPALPPLRAIFGYDRVHRQRCLHVCDSWDLLHKKNRINRTFPCESARFTRCPIWTWRFTRRPFYFELETKWGSSAEVFWSFSFLQHCDAWNGFWVVRHSASLRKHRALLQHKNFFLVRTHYLCHNRRNVFESIFLKKDQKRRKSRLSCKEETRWHSPSVLRPFQTLTVNSRNLFRAIWVSVAITSEGHVNRACNLAANLEHIARGIWIGHDILHIPVPRT